MSGDQRMVPPEGAAGQEPRPAVVDRIVDGRTAVLQVDPDGTELQLPAHALPDGADEGTWLHLDVATDPPRVLGIDPERTAARRRDVSARLQRVRDTRRGGRFDR